MQQRDMSIRVFHIPGGEDASLSVYQHLSKLLETHDDLLLTVYRGQNRHDGTWSLVLIGETTSLAPYQEQIQHFLSEVKAQPLLVPPESLIPLIERFFAAHTEMRRTKTSFVEKHHKKKKTAHPSKKEKKRKER